MDTELLRTFVEVVNTRHFGRAAEGLYITQSAVSFRIRQLEQSLGATLFIRQRNNIQLTASGERLLPHAQMILTGMQRVKAEVTLSNHMVAQLSIAGTANIWDAVLQSNMGKLVIALPDVSLTAEVKGLQECTRLLLDRALDVAVLFDPPKVDGLVVKSIGHLSILPVSTFECSDAVMFFDTQYVYVDWGVTFSTWHAKQFQGQMPYYFKTSTGRIALDLMMNRGGGAFISQNLISDMLKSGEVYHINVVAGSSKEVFAVYHKDSGQLPAIEVAVDSLAAFM
ncbi:LysR family transcriptional regulator [Pseudoalteromonas sp. MMG005]|uniref:LysR family transcriptional regulator n=1 Tax=Pseudoalteromonas sp. MMG005 TaxID=2822682 RepID=UPI001B3A76C8|nr:LysR family transcriptional regulator [Pseudoalteromonas sp. MMG005]MBQ4846426.1 LysR family transcriptional regulator [Pseudoalteromonas sp. MMG005]